MRVNKLYSVEGVQETQTPEAFIARVNREFSIVGVDAFWQVDRILVSIPKGTIRTQTDDDSHARQLVDQWASHFNGIARETDLDTSIEDVLKAAVNRFGWRLESCIKAA